MKILSQNYKTLIRNLTIYFVLLKFKKYILENSVVVLRYIVEILNFRHKIIDLYNIYYYRLTLEMINDI